MPSYQVGRLDGTTPRDVATDAPPTVTAQPTPRRVDWTRVLITGEVVVGGVLIAYRLAARPPASPIAKVSMGPGGWVSMKGGTVAVRPARNPLGRPRPVPPPRQGRAPVWARVISAVPLQLLIR